MAWSAARFPEKKGFQTFASRHPKEYIDPVNFVTIQNLRKAPDIWDSLMQNQGRPR